MSRSTESLLEQKIADLEALIETLQRAPIQVIIDHLEVKHEKVVRDLKNELALTKKHVEELKQQVVSLGGSTNSYFSYYSS